MSMNLDDIKPFLEASTAVDVGTAYELFQREAGTDDVDLFLVFLRNRGYLSNADFLELHATCFTVELTTTGADREVDSTIGARLPGPPSHREDQTVPTSSDQRSRPPPHAPPPRYTLLGTVGEGGMGVIKVAKDTQLRRKVALKQLKPEAASRENAKRFISEAQITAQLDHPNIVPVYALERHASGSLSYTMKLIQGRTLKALIEEARALHARRAPVDESRSLQARLEHFLKACDAIAFAHSKGVIHRDLKPDNIMIGQYNEVYVMDWGIARLIGRAGEVESTDPTALVRRRLSGEVNQAGDAWADAENDADVTAEGDMLGTPRYMSPEQAATKNSELDGRSDEYSLGLVLFELVTLRKAIPGRSSLEVCENALSGVKAPLVHEDPRVKIPRRLRAIIEKATALRPEDRYTAVKEMAEDVRRYLRGAPVLAAPDAPFHSAFLALKARWGAVLALAAALVLGAALVVSLWRSRESAHTALEGRAELEMNSRSEARSLRRRAIQAATHDLSHEIDARLSEIRGLARGVVAASAQAIARGSPSPEKIYLEADFGPGHRAPPDLEPASVYRGAASVEWPVWVIAPDASRYEMLLFARRLSPIRRDCQRVLRWTPESASRADGAGGEDDAANERARPVVGCSIGLAGGAAAIQPGSYRAAKEYGDPRARPWYKAVIDNVDVAWGTPYVGEQKGKMIVPCGAPLFDDSGRRLGAASLEVSLEIAIGTLLSGRVEGGVLGAAVVDRDGVVLVRASADGDDPFGGSGGLPGAPDPAPNFLDLPEILRSARGKPSDFMEIERDARTLAVAISRLRSAPLYVLMVGVVP